MNVVLDVWQLQRKLFDVTLKYSVCCFKRKLEKRSWLGTEIWVPLTFEVMNLHNVERKCGWLRPEL